MQPGGSDRCVTALTLRRMTCSAASESAAPFLTDPTNFVYDPHGTVAGPFRGPPDDEAYLTIIKVLGAELTRYREEGTESP
jgi:hypothetical protein